MPSGEPSTVNPPSASFRSTAASNVPPPRSYTATTDALVDPLLRGVGDGGRLGLGHEHHARDPGDLGGLLEQVALVRAPVGRVGEHDGAGPLAAPGVDRGLDHPAQQLAREHLGRDAAVADEQRGGVAEAALELAGDATGVGDRVALGRVAGDEAAVGLQPQDGRERSGHARRG